MKTLTTSSKSKLLLLVLALVPALASAGLVGKVHELKGQAFKVHGGKTTVLKVDSDIEEGADVMVGDDSSLTLGDFFDRRHHVGAGTHLTMNDRAVVLKKGALWTQSVGTKSSGQVTTANMLIQAEQGEWVTTYDAATRRTQLTAINGEVRVASPQEPAFQYAVAAGMFSLADPKVDDGYPRSPTKLGYESLMKTLAIFPGQKSRDPGLAKVQEKATATREIASVDVPAPKKGEITVISHSGATRSVASTEDGTAQNYFLQKATKKKMKAIPVGATFFGATTAPVRIFGLTNTVARTPAARKPASVRPTAKPSESLDDNSNDFIKSYEQQIRKQPVNSTEVQRLIDELQSH